MAENQPLRSKDLSEVIGCLRERLGKHWVVGAPLGLGKPNHLINAIYQEAKSDPSIKLELFTALSLNPPKPAKGLKQRFLQAFVQRQFGDYPRLQYLRDLDQGTVPANITISEFYFRSGSRLGDRHAQRNYVSSNYTHVARDMRAMGINVLVQMVGVRPDRPGHVSLGSNPDVTLDLLRSMPRDDLLLLVQCNKDMPYMAFDAEIPVERCDLLLDEHPQRLFAVPRMPVSDADYLVGLHASALVRDGGTMQLGIGSLGDAVSYFCALRQQQNPRYLELLEAAATRQRTSTGLIDQWGGDAPFEAGLYAASEMFTDGFLRLYDAGVLKRKVQDYTHPQHPPAPEPQNEERQPEISNGVLLHAAFFLGSQWMYDRLNDMSDQERGQFRMTAVSRINQLYGNEAQDRAQRLEGRFINTTMKMTLLGAAVSDQLDDGQVVSGVGGQYNFVAMAHALERGRSVLMLRSHRGSGKHAESNIVWTFPHATIPRHLRDIVVTEYGVADLRSCHDEQVIQKLICLADSRWQEGLRLQAVRAGKLDESWSVPEIYTHNTPQWVQQRLAPWRKAGDISDYPFGSDFTPQEQQLAKALSWLADQGQDAAGRVRLLLKAVARRTQPDQDTLACLQRMQLEQPANLRERLDRRLLLLAISTTRD